MTNSEQKAIQTRKPQGDLQGVKMVQGLEKAPKRKADVSGHGSGAHWMVCGSAAP
jgi:hypothetical protein